MKNRMLIFFMSAFLALSCNSCAKFSPPAFEGNVHTVYETTTFYHDGVKNLEGEFTFYIPVLSEKEKDEYGAPSSVCRVYYLFDEQNRLTEFTYLKKDGTVILRNVYEYKGNNVRPAILTEYDEEGNIIEQIKGKNIKWEWSEEEKKYSYVNYTQEYDEKGNWTKKTSQIKTVDIPYQVIERVITYYP